jgi:Flp pilus assembly protein TadG
MSICNQTPSRPAKNSTLVKRFMRDAKGSITPLMGLVSIPFFLAAGAAIDMSRATREQQAFYGAVDSAALAMAADDRAAFYREADPVKKEAKRLELETYARKWLEKNYVDASHGKTVKTLTLAGTNKDLTITASLTFPTTITRLVGYNSMTLNATSKVSYGMRPIEIAMVMDTTGSMEDSVSGGSTKIVAARAAGQKLLDTLYSGTVAAKPKHDDIRVALVPFSGAVRLDTAGHDFETSWIDTTGINPLSKINFNEGKAPAAGAETTSFNGLNNFTAWSRMKETASAPLAWNGCVESRSASLGYHIDDTPPNSSNGATLFPAYLNPDTAGVKTTGNSSVSTSLPGYSYIIPGTSSSTTGEECSGLTSTECSATTNTAKIMKQENFRKYTGAVVGQPASATSSYTTNIKFTQYHGPWGGCAPDRIVGLTHDRAKVETGVTQLRAHGITVIPEGLAWGWRVLSPGAPFTKVQGYGSIADTTIAPYDSPRWKKILVLMTDGDNGINGGSYSPNLSNYSAYGMVREPTGSNLNRFGTNSGSAAETALDNYTQNATANVCKKIKDAGITIYVTSFGSAVSSTTQTMLRNCASSPDKYEHNTTALGLSNFFLHIGEDVLSNSIYVSK